MQNSFLCLLLSIGLLLVCTISLQAQSLPALTQAGPSKKTETDSLLKDPNKALLWGLIPGGGQVYNGQYLKSPIFAGGFVGITAFAIKRRRDYNRHFKAFNEELSNSTGTSTLSDDFATIRNKKKRALRDYNIAVNGAAIFYAFGLADAYMSAQVINDGMPRSPIRAAYLSAVLPGLGQAYNKRYWKIPIVYGGLGAAGYFVFYNADRMQRFTNEYLSRNSPGFGEPDPAMARYTSNTVLLANRSRFRKNMQISIFVGVGWYLLNIIDALVDAHLRDFDIDDDLSLRVSPYIMPVNTLSGMERPAGGMKVSLRF